MTPEGKVKKQIDAVLKKYGVYSFKPVQNGMGKPGLDYHCVLPPYGLAVMIEAKAPGKKPTARQKLTIKEIEQAGGKVFVCDGNIKELETFICELMLLQEAGHKK